jgi:uncharacterized RDD family membrane protein YckC
VNRYVGLATRTLAFAVDAAIIDVVAWGTAAIVALCLSLIGIHGEIRTLIAGIGAILAAGGAIVYFAFFWSASGQTFGNRMLGIRVVDAASGRPISGRRALLRVGGVVLAAIPLCAGFLLILVDRRRRGLQDLIARTVVIDAREDERSGEDRRRRRAREPRAEVRDEPVEAEPSGDGTLAQVRAVSGERL